MGNNKNFLEDVLIWKMNKIIEVTTSDLGKHWKSIILTTCSSDLKNYVPTNEW